MLDNLTICFCNIQDSPVVYPGATFHWAPVQPLSVVETEDHKRWKIEGQIRKINVKSRTFESGHITIQGIQVFMENGETQAFGMDLNDTVQVDSLEVPVGEHIKEFVVRSDFYLNAIGVKTNKDKTYGLIGGNWGPLRNSGPIMKGLEHYYVDGIQGLTVVNQICEIQFKSVIVPSSVQYPLSAPSKSQMDSDFDDSHSDERLQRNPLDDFNDYILGYDNLDNSDDFN